MSISAQLPSREKTSLLFADLTYKIRGAIFDVYNELGFGHKEQVYQKALAKEFIYRKISYHQELPLPVSYKGETVGSYRPDFSVEGKIIIELKATELNLQISEKQLAHYLRSTGFQLGLLVNFGTPQIYIKRIINTSGGNKYVRE